MSFKPEQFPVPEAGERAVRSAKMRWFAAVPLFIGVAAGVAYGLSRAEGPTPPDPSDELAALHAAAGVDPSMFQGATASGAAIAADSVGPVNASFHAELETLKTKLAEEPEDLAVLQRLATILHDAHRREEAAEYYRRLLDLDPANRQAWLDLADCLGGLALWEEVRESMVGMMAQHPDDPTALYNLGVAEINTGNVAAAREWWERAASQDSDGAVAAMAQSALDRTRGAV